MTTENVLHWTHPTHQETGTTDFLTTNSLLPPSFSKWNPKWGKISIKQQGGLENGSVYCHGTLFKALADYERGDIDEMMGTILRCLPTNPKNPYEINMQLPLYVSNYYFGLDNENYGRSSCQYNTDTTAWILALLNRIKK